MNCANLQDDSIVRSAREYLNDLDVYLEMNEMDSGRVRNNGLIRSQSLEQLAADTFTRNDFKRQTVSVLKQPNFGARKIRKYPQPGNLNEITSNQTNGQYDEKYLEYCTVRKKGTKKHIRTNSAPSQMYLESENKHPLVSTIPNIDEVSIRSASENSQSTPDNPDNDVNRPVLRSVFNCNRINEVNENSESLTEVGTENRKYYEGLSSMFTNLGCTIGLFNISRFAIVSVQFGGVFLLQFGIMSILMGIPMFSLQQALGQKLKSNMIDMWFITPLFQGIGIALLSAQSIFGVYTVVGLSWILVYFRDSFNAIHNRSYEWSRIFTYNFQNGNTIFVNNSIAETIPNYWNDVVLQRHSYDLVNMFGNIQFQAAFNLAVVWMLVFVALSKGLKSYKITFFNFLMIALTFFIMFFIKIVSIVPSHVYDVFIPEMNWADFLRSTNWMAASQEAFLTWCLFSPAVMQLSIQNKRRKHLKRNLKFVIVLTNLILLLSALLAKYCVHILYLNGFSYRPSSYERLHKISFLSRNQDGLSKPLSNVPVKYLKHNSFIVGEETKRLDFDRVTDSGYQVLRFATELFPAAISLIGFENVSCYWTVTFYLSLIFFGIAQQLVVWNSVITGITALNFKTLKEWEITITFFSCVWGFFLGLAFTTDSGIRLMYFFDYVIGGSWWLMLLLFLQINAVFLVRGRPYTADTLVKEFFVDNDNGNDNNQKKSYLTLFFEAYLTIAWSLILPITLMILCVVQFKQCDYRDLYRWTGKKSYWSYSEKQFGSFLQSGLILCVSGVAAIQCYKYLTNGPDDILERIQLLYRPNLRDNSNNFLNGSPETGRQSNNDPPPKYSPPPSYSTATGAQIAKMLRRSFRRTLRRVNNLLSSDPARGNGQNSIRSTGDVENVNSITSTVVDVACTLRNSFRSILPNSNLNANSVSVENLIHS